MDKTRENTIDINPIPYLTWTWLKINKDSVAYDFSLAENKGSEVQLPEGINVSSGKSISSSLPEPEFSIGEEAAKLISEAATEGKIYTVEKSTNQPLIIRIKLDSNSATHQIIHAKAGTEANVIIVYEDDPSRAAKTVLSEVLSGVITKVYAEEASKLHISKIQLCGKSLNQIDDTAVVCGERAKVTLTQIELGGAHIDAGFHATLEGYQSEFYSDTAYICRNNQYLDMNQVVVHKGKKTVCDMKTHGTAKDESTKTYRGTIDMRRGCAGSVGNEIETTLLLSPKAVVKAAPIILCGEEDIAAEHGSTIGKLSNEMLFYMNSRGIDQKTAEDLLTRAKITAAAVSIEDEGIQEEINNFLSE
ncbi:MAG: SufD family Fe-S cluster assembly protein [Spirochaetales bacterium]|nr:SufD family Fe-S cluster assembly protein [Spirochaetales bacterium]